MTFNYETTRLLKKVGIKILHFGPYKDYWELVYETPFLSHNKNPEPYTEESKTFVVRKTFHDPSETKMLWALAADLDLYVEAVKEALEAVEDIAITREKADVRDDS
jgi:hypothetical protein